MGKENVTSARVFLKPGEIFVSREPTIISTVLGSCVAVTMFSPRARVGAICHATLPERGGISELAPSHFVSSVVPYMMERLEKLGVERKEIETKLFGGADMFSAAEGSCTSATVGEKNIKKALEIIKNERLRLLVYNVGGKTGRKLFFYTHTGEIFLRHINKN
jgi:chemotaxis protein CheD